MILEPFTYQTGVLTTMDYYNAGNTKAHPVPNTGMDPGFLARGVHQARVVYRHMEKGAWGPDAKGTLYVSGLKFLM